MLKQLVIRCRDGAFQSPDFGNRSVFLFAEYVEELCLFSRNLPVSMALKVVRKRLSKDVSGYY
jgi:hypothetical protein